MNKDLEEHINEMGLEYLAVVNRLKNAREVEPAAAAVRRRPFSLKRGWFFAAASAGLAAACAFMVKFDDGFTPSLSQYRLAHVGTRSAIEEIIRTQNPDGSWNSDYLTKQNAAALRLADGAQARLAYKKACRAMRLKGIL